LNEADADAEVLEKEKGERRYTGRACPVFLHSILRHFRLILKSLTNPFGWVGPVLCESSGVARKLLFSNVGWDILDMLIRRGDGIDMISSDLIWSDLMTVIATAC